MMVSVAFLVAVLAIVSLSMLGLPVGHAMIGGSVLYLYLKGMDMGTAAEQLLNGTYSSFLLLAIPLFILAGGLMETGGISRRLVALATALVGHLRGGLAHVTVVGEILFSGISGSTTADVAVLGAMLLPAMEREGYRRAEAVAIVSAAAAMGILVPPCLLMVLLATIAILPAAIARNCRRVRARREPG